MNKSVKLKDFDRDVLRILYKTDFLSEIHIAALTGENKDYCKQRLKRLKNAGLINRKVISERVINWITKKGIQEAGLPERSVREPSIGQYAHSLGCADVYTWLALRRPNNDGTTSGLSDFGNIITERDIHANRELRQVGTRRDGQPIYADKSKGIHIPDGYFVSGNNFYAIEYERTRKSSKDIIRQNMLENSRRFRQQFWVYDSPSVETMLRGLQEELGRDKILLYNLTLIREQIVKIVNRLPAEISEKSGVPANSCVGSTMAQAIPLYKLPIIQEAVPKVQLEQRSPMADSQLDNNRANPAGPKQLQYSNRIEHNIMHTTKQLVNPGVMQSHPPVSPSSEVHPGTYLHLEKR